MTANQLGRLLLLLGISGGAGGCATPKANVWNLQQVHRPDGSASYSGNLRSSLEARIFGLGDLGQVGGKNLPSIASVFGIEGGANEKLEPIDDPYAVAMENLLELTEFDPEKSEETRALQVETFSWLAADSVFPLVRERSTLELGRVGRILHVDESQALAPDIETIGPDQLEPLLKELVSAVRNNRDLGQAEQNLRDAAMNRDGLRRAVRTVTILRFAGSGKGLGLGQSKQDRRQALGELHDELQTRLVSQSLQAALDDPIGIVRAAAVQAAVKASNNSLPALLQWAIVRARTEVVEVRALDALAKYGFPKWDEATSAEKEEEYRRSWVELCVAKLRSAYDGPVSVAAAQALKRLAPNGPDSLRMEDWGLWLEQSQPLDPEAAWNESSLSE